MSHKHPGDGGSAFGVHPGDHELQLLPDLEVKWPASCRFLRLSDDVAEGLLCGVLWAVRPVLSRGTLKSWTT